MFAQDHSHISITVDRMLDKMDPEEIRKELIEMGAKVNDIDFIITAARLIIRDMEIDFAAQEQIRKHIAGIE